MKRLTAVLLCFLAATGAARVKHAKYKAPGKRVLPIAIVLNGTRMAINPAPFFYEDRLYVPVRRVLAALGLNFDTQGGHIVTYAGSRTIEVTGGIERHNTLFVPLRFFADALGAQAAFNRQTNSVEILSTLVGTTGNGISEDGGSLRETGTIAAVDLNSSPPSVTITYNASVRTLHLRGDAQVIVQDVNTGTGNAGTLEDLHPGDFAELRLDRAGDVKQIVDAYGSRIGKVAGEGSGSIVLDDGQVVTPDRSTVVTLNGAESSIDRLAVGDDVMVRYNVDSSEVREIIATRAGAAASQNGSVSSIAFEPQTPLRAGDKLYVTLHGTPGAGIAHFDIGPYVQNVGLHETSPGVYTGDWLVKRGVNFSQAPIFGRLLVNGADTPPVESSGTVSVSTLPPGVDDFAPDSGVTVNNSRPAIYAGFVAGTVPIDVSSERIIVNGHDVTAAGVRTARFIDYMPGVDFDDGTVNVEVRVSDLAGNLESKRWTFYVKRSNK